jgi:hypothetical protein
MCGFVIGDFLKVGIEWIGEPSSDEVRLSVVGKTFSVEFILKVFKCKRIIQNLNCGKGKMQAFRQGRSPTVGNISLGGNGT